MDVFDTQSTAERKILDLRKVGVTDVPVIGHYTYRRAGQVLPRETHTDHFEVTFLSKGVQIYETEGQRTVLRGGDLYLTRPGESHSTAGQPEEKGEAYWMFIRKHTSKTSLRLNKAATGKLMQALSDGRRSGRSTAQLQEHLNQIFALYEQCPQDPLATATLEARVELLILELAHCLTRETDTSVGGAIGKVLELLNTEGRWDAGIGDLAKEAHLSEARFKVRFKQEVGIPPGEYLMRRRVEKAKLWLRKSPMRVVDIARELAFPTSQYFATVFKRYTGKTPQVWRTSRKS